MADEQEIRVIDVRPGVRSTYWVVVFSKPLRMADGTPDTAAMFPPTAEHPDRLSVFRWALEQIEIHKALTS